MADEKRKRCYIYTRVSTEMQVEGYSLDAQEERLRKYAEGNDIEVIKTFSDAGKSGKNVSGRPEFQKMMDEIQNKTDAVDYVLVFKLSRFGRNAADVLTNLQIMQDYGVNLIAVDDGIDTSKDTGKLIATVIASVAELERENIVTQTTEGRRQKAREGRWNGGPAPYGYSIGEDDVLQINEDEAPLVRKIFGLYADGGYGIAKTAKILNEDGYKRIPRGNMKGTRITDDFVKKVLDNPVYVGKIVYGRREKKKVEGKRNEYKRVKSDDYEVSDGLHEPIISEEVWNRTRRKREKSAIKKDNHSNTEHCYILSGLIRCPVCGGPMYGLTIKRKKKHGDSYYKPIYYYACNNHRRTLGSQCSFSRQIREEDLDAQVQEAVFELLKGTEYMDILTKRMMDVDGQKASIIKEIEDLGLKRDKEQRKYDKYNEKLKDLDIDDIHYDEEYDRLTDMINDCSDNIKEYESKIAEQTSVVQNFQENQMSYEETLQEVLRVMSEFADLSPETARQLYQVIIDSIQIFPEKRSDGQIVKNVKLVFPIYSKGYPVEEIIANPEKFAYDYTESGDGLPDGGMGEELDSSDHSADTTVDDSFKDDADSGDNSTDDCIRNQSPDETAMLLVRR